MEIITLYVECMARISSGGSRVGGGGIGHRRDKWCCGEIRRKKISSRKFGVRKVIVTPRERKKTKPFK